jgi:hypothetical protein
VVGETIITGALPVAQLERLARVVTTGAPTSSGVQAEIRPLAATGENVILIAGTLDTKGAELRYMRDLIRAKTPEHYVPPERRAFAA